MWEEIHVWESEAFVEVYVSLYELYADSRKVAHIQPWKQRIKEVEGCEVVDLWKVELPKREPKKRAPNAGRGRGRAKGKAKAKGRARGARSLRRTVRWWCGRRCVR